MIIEIQPQIDQEVKLVEIIEVDQTLRVTLSTIEIPRLVKKEEATYQLRVKKATKAKKDLNMQAGLTKENTTRIVIRKMILMKLISVQ